MDYFDFKQLLSNASAMRTDARTITTTISTCGCIIGEHYTIFARRTAILDGKQNTFTSRFRQREKTINSIVIRIDATGRRASAHADFSRRC